MKSHARNFGVGAVLVPLALALATLIANEAQTLIGLHLDNVALSLYLLPFLLGAALAIAALLRLEAAKIGGVLGGILGGLADELTNGAGAESPAGAPGRPGPSLEDLAKGLSPGTPTLDPPPPPPAP